MSRIAEWRNTVDDPPIARALFNDTRLSWLWLLVRLYVGYSWITAGIEKMENSDWAVTGNALKGFWTGAVAVSATGKSAITFSWYRDFLTFMLNGGHYVWFSKVVIFGELAIGTAMILGAFVGVAAFFGGFMNWNFMMAGSASVNPVLFSLSILLILAWKTAGYIGVDRVLLPLLGTPWRPGIVTAGGRVAQPVVAGGSGKEALKQ
jgi:thiosulfate dehydrogenase (quinone) large subunit